MIQDLKSLTITIKRQTSVFNPLTGQPDQLNHGFSFQNLSKTYKIPYNVFPYSLLKKITKKWFINSGIMWDRLCFHVNNFLIEIYLMRWPSLHRTFCMVALADASNNNSVTNQTTEFHLWYKGVWNRRR